MSRKFSEAYLPFSLQKAWINAINTFCSLYFKTSLWHSLTDILLHYSRPVKLIEIVKKRFISLGGVIFEGCSLSSISIYDDAAVSLWIFTKLYSWYCIWLLLDTVICQQGWIDSLILLSFLNLMDHIPDIPHNKESKHSS